MSIRAEIISQIEQIAKENDVSDLPVLSDDLALTASGLDSLMIAVLVARLQDNFGVDPFTDSAEDSYPVTLGDFIRLYESAPTQSDIPAGKDR